MAEERTFKLAGVAVLIAFGAGSFYAGAQYDRSYLASNMPGENSLQDISTQNQSGMSAGGVLGTVISKNASGFVVKPFNGSANITITYNRSTPTTLTKTTTVSPSDVSVGYAVSVTGQMGAGGMKATGIQIMENSPPPQ